MEESVKVLIFDAETFGDRDIVEAFIALGHEPVIIPLKPVSKERDESFMGQCLQVVKDKHVDMVFTSNFYPSVAEVCRHVNIVYVAWVYDSPQLLLYHQSIHYPTNYVFMFDSAECEKLAGLGVKTVYYMPLAVNVERLDKLVATEEQKKKYSADVAFVGTFYDQKSKFYDRLSKHLSDYDKGYLEALMQAQRNVYGYFFLEERLREHDILERMYEAMPYAIEEDYFATKEYAYANYFLGRKIAEIERKEVLGILGQVCDTKVYTNGDTGNMPGIKHMGTLEYYEEMPIAFRQAKINLNISLRTIQTGIPLRCFDIMGAGGFLLTNYQADFEPLFEAGVDYVYYDSKMDMYDKIVYYLEHDEERQWIARNGYEKVRNHHSYVKRLADMLQIVKGD